MLCLVPTPSRAVQAIGQEKLSFLSSDKPAYSGGIEWYVTSLRHFFLNSKQVNRLNIVIWG